MASNKSNIKTWANVQSFLSELGLEEQLRMAELMGVEVPSEVQTAVAAKAAMGSIQVEFGSKRFQERVYLTFDKGCPIGGATKSGSPRVGGSPYLELRGLDAEIARLTIARDSLKEAGFNTSPSAPEAQGTMEQALKAGFGAKDNRVKKAQ